MGKKCKTEIWENHCKQKVPGTISESNLNFNEYKFDMPSRAEKILAAKTRDMAPNDSKKIKDIEVIKSLWENGCHLPSIESDVLITFLV